LMTANAEQFPSPFAVTNPVSVSNSLDEIGNVTNWTINSPSACLLTHAYLEW